MKDDCYELKDNVMKLYDPELDLDLTVSIDLNSKVIEYEDEIKVSEAYYKNEKLHGPAAQFGENGECLSYRWFVDGQCEGKVWEYYLSGQVSALQRYRHGLREGFQKQYYEDGTVKMKSCYH
ncbi:MAG: hypothetical protein P0S94_05770, partial [Simkaniaceae bacterium]|nr:hypothetical protein [Simkaniaceae bacterium]